MTTIDIPALERERYTATDLTKRERVMLQAVRELLVECDETEKELVEVQDELARAEDGWDDALETIRTLEANYDD